MRVIFRKFKDGGDIIALLPDVPANPGRIMSYMHVGQHSEASPGIVRGTQPVDLADNPPANRLFCELARIYKPEPLRILKRLPSRKVAA